MKPLSLLFVLVFLTTGCNSPIGPSENPPPPPQGKYESLPVTHVLKDEAGVDTLVSIELLNVTPLRGSVAPRMSTPTPCLYEPIAKDCVEVKFRLHFLHPKSNYSVSLQIYFSMDPGGEQQIGFREEHSYPVGTHEGRITMKVNSSAPKYVYFRGKYDKEGTAIDIVGQTSFLIDLQ